MTRVLQHPYITGLKYSRLVGDQPEYDVFISYRVASDAAHAEALYDRLIKKGLTVW
jgi:hypothetical protein